jgi:hypothetical protein
VSDLQNSGGEPELELDRQPRQPSSPRVQAVRSAAREGAPAPVRKKISRESLQEGFADTVLNSVSILGEVIEDFRSSDRFFKYKAFILLSWFGLTVGAFGVACPSRGPANDINARLVIGSDGTAPVYMVKNESAEAWVDVAIIVNGTYRSTMSQIEANGGNVTLSPAVIFDANGNRAPKSLQIRDIEVRSSDPEATVVLLKGGVPLHQ